LKLKEQQIKENKKVTGLSKKEYIVLALIAISLIIKLIITK
jgi:DNA-binding CsgD family transcriptional regulator